MTGPPLKRPSFDTSDFRARETIGQKIDMLVTLTLPEWAWACLANDIEVSQDEGQSFTPVEVVRLVEIASGD